MHNQETIIEDPSIRAELSETGEWELDQSSGDLRFSLPYANLLSKSLAHGKHSIEDFLTLFTEDSIARWRNIFSTKEPQKKVELVQSLEDRFFRVTYKRLRNKRLVGMLEDVTDRVKARESFFMATVAIDKAFHGIAIVDRNGRFVIMNTAHAEIFGVSSPSELVGKHWSVLYDENELKKWKGRFIELQKAGKWSGECIARRMCGARFPQHVELTLLENGEIVCVCKDLTEEKERERHLGERERLYREMVNQAPVMIWEVDARQENYFVNKPCKDFTGLKENELTLENWEKRVYPDDRRRVIDTYKNSFNAREEFELEYRLLRHDGEYRWVLVRGIPRFSSSGRFMGFGGFVLDINDRYELQEELKHKSRDYELIFHNVPAQIYYKDRNNVILRANRTAANILGTTPEALEGTSTKDVNPIYADRYAKNDSEVLRTGKPKFGLIEPIETKSGRIRWGKTDKIPYYDSERKQNCILVFVSEITEQIEAEQALEASKRALELERNELRKMINEAPIPVAMLDRNLNYIAYSARWGDESKLDEKPRIGSGFLDQISEEESFWRDALEKTKRGHPVGNSEEVVNCSDGTKMFYRWAARPWFQEGRAIGGVILVKDRIDELVAAREKALEASRIKSAFIANVSHEIRTPLHGVIGLIGLLEQTKLDDNQEYYLQSLDSSANALLAVISDILDFSRIELGAKEIRNEALNVKLLAQNAVDIVAPLALTKGVGLTLEIDPSISDRLIGDELKLRQVLLNLLGNAVKFTEEGSVTLRLKRKRTSSRPHEILFSVSDTGLGIPKSMRHKIFDPFTQLDDSTTRNVQGSGLGLTIARDLVRNLGSEIQLHSEPGKGSEFSFSLEMRPQKDVEQKTPEKPEESSVEPPKKVKILLAEDHEVARLVLSESLRAEGFDVVCAENGKIALEEMEKQKFDMALIDCQMPIVDGYAVIEQVSSWEEKEEKPLLVALTAHAREEDRKRCLELGAASYFSKPIKPKALVSKIRALLEERSFAKPENASLQQDLRAQIEELKETMGGGEAFKSSLKTLLERIHRAREYFDKPEDIVLNDLSELRQRAHDLVTTCSLLGTPDLIFKLKGLEESCVEKKRPQAKKYALEVTRNLKAIDTQLRKISIAG